MSPVPVSALPLQGAAAIASAGIIGFGPRGAG